MSTCGNQYSVLRVILWSAGSSGRPKMTEDGDILYAKPRSIKPRTQQQLQQTVERAQKHIPGAARSITALAA